MPLLIIFVFGFFVQTSFGAAGNVPVIGVFSQYPAQNLDRKILECQGAQSITKASVSGFDMFEGIVSEVKPVFQKKEQWSTFNSDCNQIAKGPWKLTSLSVDLEVLGPQKEISSCGKKDDGFSALTSKKKNSTCAINVKNLKDKSEIFAVALRNTPASKVSFIKIDLKNLNKGIFNQLPTKKLTKALVNEAKGLFILSYHTFADPNDEVGDDHIEIKNKSGSSLFHQKATLIKIVDLRDYDGDGKSEILIETNDSTGGNASHYSLLSEQGKLLAKTGQD